MIRIDWLGSRWDCQPLALFCLGFGFKSVESPEHGKTLSSLNISACWFFIAVTSVLQEDMTNESELQCPGDLSVTDGNDGLPN